MAKKRANGEGNIRKRADGRWEGRYTAGYCRICNPPGKGGYKGQSHISALAQHLLTMLKFTLETETNRNPFLS